MTGLYLSAIMLAVAVLAQATLLPRIRFFDASPNLVLVFLVSWSLLRGAGEGIIWAFVGGLIFDLIAGLPPGTSSLALVIVCFLAAAPEGSLYQGHLFLPMIALAIATPVYAWIVLLTQQLRGLGVDWGGTTLRVVTPELLLNVVLVALLYPVLRWVIQRAGAEYPGW